MALPFRAYIAYEDPVIQPLILAAFEFQLPASSYSLTHRPLEQLSSREGPVLQLCSYETLDFDHALSHPQPGTQLINAYIIRKALIRKHYLSHTIHSWVTKHPDSPLKKHFKSGVDFELDYAEFLDEALLEAYELKESFGRNAERDAEGKMEKREWWILKPGMSDRGQGIRLFSSEEELRRIFEGWEEDEEEDDDNYEPDDSDSDVDDDDDGDSGMANDCDDEDELDENDQLPPDTEAPLIDPPPQPKSFSESIKTSHLRHFTAQPYIHPPLLLPQAPYNNRKFHIRTYVVCAGALQVYVYEHMLALFASRPYEPPWTTHVSESSTTPTAEEAHADLLQMMRDTHLTNTCIQSASASPASASKKRPDAVHLLSSLPLPPTTLTSITTQIHTVTSELFRAALAHPTSFQPLPGSFEVFGVDFLVSCEPEGPNVWLLEVNAFPDFGQTGEWLMEKVVGGLWESIVRTVVRPYFGVRGAGEGAGAAHRGDERLIRVLDVDMLRT